MSGIAGAYFPRATSAGFHPDTKIDSMMRAIAHRGPDDLNVKMFDEGFIGNAHSGAGTDGFIFNGAITVSLAGRIDNLDDLSAKFGGSLGKTSTDAEFVHAAYKKWGTDCADQLKGDFAIAIRDGERRRLVLIRDRFGVCPLYFHENDNGVVFASEIGALLAFKPALASDLSHQVICDYVAGEISQDKSETIYSAIRRLPPAHMLVADGNGVRISSYWRLQPKPVASKEAPEQFRALLTEAVSRRLRAKGPLACALSGGLDSSSIACIAAEQIGGRPLTTLSMYYDDEFGADERPYINAILEKYPALNPQFIDVSKIASFGSLADAFTAHGRPPLAINRATGSRPAYEAAWRVNAKILLDGHGGDEVVSYGSHYLVDLAARGKWLSLWREIDIRSFPDEDLSRIGVFKKLYMKHGVAPGAARALKKALQGKNARSAAADPPYWAYYLSDNCRDIDAHEQRYSRNETGYADLSPSQKAHILALTDARQAYAFETLDHDTAHSGAEMRYPFWDQDLVEFCVSVDGSEKWKDGWSRALLRRGLNGVMPEKILARRDKFDFTPALARSMAADGGLNVMRRAVHDNADLITPYANVGFFRTVFEKFQNDISAVYGRDLHALWRITMLSSWLERRSKGAARGWHG